MIVIEVADDGRGISVEAVRKKAVDRGLIHSSKALSDVEAFSLIFDPGFSTAQKVSNISGRGVGLDVVKQQIEKLNGTVTVSSEAGAGTRFTIKIPLTLAIIQGLMVRVGAETYAIPITSVIESQRIRPDEIRYLDNHEVLNVREDVVSLLRLARIFRIESKEEPSHFFVVIVGTGDKKVGLVVDALIGEEDVVIKPLRDRYTNAPGIAGANITGDGRVSLIVDVAQLIDMGLRDEQQTRKRREAVIGN
jgi:two-component system chemotaxis sensor kinase CheA